MFLRPTVCSFKCFLAKSQKGRKHAQVNLGVKFMRPWTFVHCFYFTDNKRKIKETFQNIKKYCSFFNIHIGLSSHLDNLFMAFCIFICFCTIITAGDLQQLNSFGWSTLEQNSLYCYSLKKTYLFKVKM